ncbi:MAG: hypothetical protein ACREAM_06420 [Blastocatellia bacterium]
MEKKDEAKEFWPGAGLWLDLDNAEYADPQAVMTKVGRRLEELASTSERLLWLERFKIEFKDLRLRAVARRRKERAAQGLSNDPAYIEEANHLHRQANIVIFNIDILIRKLEGILEIEKKQELDRRYQAESAKKEDEDRLRLAALARQAGEAGGDPVPGEDAGGDPDPGKWDNLPAAVALCALLRAAGLPDGISDRAVGRFAKLLTGRSSGKMAAAHHNAVYGSFDDKHAEAVADALTDLGLTKLAADVRKKFQTAEN